MDRAASLSKLVGQVLDFLGQLAVLTASSLEMLGEFIVGGLGTEQVGGEIAVVALGGIELAGQVVGLLLPLFDDAVEALLLLLQSGSIGSGTLDIDLKHVYKRLVGTNSKVVHRFSSTKLSPRFPSCMASFFKFRRNSISI